MEHWVQKLSTSKRQKSSASPKKAEPNRVTARGRPKPDELERRKARVIQVAMRLFIEQGFAGTSFIEIARSAGVGPNMIYQHFGDKEKLFGEVFLHGSGNTRNPLSIIRSDEDLSTTLLRAAQYLRDFAMREQTAGLMRLLIAESRRFPELTKNLADRALRAMRRDIQLILEELADRGDFADVDIEEAANVFVDMVLGTAVLRFYAGWAEGFSEDDKLPLKINMFKMGLLGVSPTRTTAAPRKRSAKPA